MEKKIYILLIFYLFDNIACIKNMTINKKEINKRGVRSFEEKSKKKIQFKLTF